MSSKIRTENRSLEREHGGQFALGEQQRNVYNGERYRVSFFFLDDGSNTVYVDSEHMGRVKLMMHRRGRTTE